VNNAWHIQTAANGAQELLGLHRRVICSNNDVFAPIFSMDAFRNLRGCQPGAEGELCDTIFDPYLSKESGTGIMKEIKFEQQACDHLLLDGCPYEEANRGRCIRLQFDSAQNPICPFRLWVAMAKPISHEDGGTTTLTTEWVYTGSARVTCSSDGNWLISDTHKEETYNISLKARATCWPIKPEIPLDAFHHLERNVATRELSDSPAFFCSPDDMVSCHSMSYSKKYTGYCVAKKVKGQSTTIKTCACLPGAKGDRCADTYFDPYLTTVWQPGQSGTGVVPTTDCLVVAANGCPFEDGGKTCEYLKTS
ncbi:hypothetical protein PFISCL1PPCAC_12201, partial [Pristionchus fissidentatus]